MTPRIVKVILEQLLTGQTAPGATVVLRRATAAWHERPVARTTADARGDYRIAIRRAMGTTAFTARATDAAGAHAEAGLGVTRANAAIAWNSVALQAIRTAHVQAPDAARDMAIVAISAFDAVNAIEPRFSSYGIAVRAPRGASSEAAAVAAASTALAGLFPDQSAMLGAQRAAALAAVPGGPGKERGAAVGDAVAHQVLALRGHDGSGVKVAYDPTPGPGV